MMTKETPNEEKKNRNKGGKKKNEIRWWTVVQVVRKPQHFLEGFFSIKKLTRVKVYIMI